MFIVYALKSEVDKRIYVGITNDIERRLKEHSHGRVKSTKGYRPWILFYKHKVKNRIEARKMEKKLKSGSGKEFLKRLNAPVTQLDRVSAF